ncbi:MAG: hypothetical protein ACI4QT_00940 [Kiritimatiellia bacterium]
MFKRSIFLITVLLSLRIEADGTEVPSTSVRWQRFCLRERQCVNGGVWSRAFCMAHYCRWAGTLRVGVRGRPLTDIIRFCNWIW